MSSGASLALSLIGLVGLGFAFVIFILLFNDTFYRNTPYEQS